MRLRSGVTVAASLLVAACLSTSSASATSDSSAILDISCPLGTQVGTYNPGLTLIPREIDFTSTGTLAACLSPSHPEITGGEFTASGSGTASCLTGSVSNTTVYHWNTGQHSTVVGSFSVNLKPGGTTVLVLVGTVTSGLFQGATAAQTKVLPATNLADCLTPEGLTSVSGPISFTATL